MPSQKRQFGDKGEALAVEYLQKKGYQIREQNFLIRQGEIDIVAEKDNEVVFVEVKTRSSTTFGSPLESISLAKMKKLSIAAQKYLQKKSWQDRDYRIDLIAVLWRRGQSPEIEHIEYAVEG